VTGDVCENSSIGGTSEATDASDSGYRTGETGESGEESGVSAAPTQAETGDGGGEVK